MNDKPQPDQPRISAGKAILFSLVTCALILLTLEWGIRLWAYSFRESYERYNAAKGRFELIPNTRFATPDGAEFLVNSKGFAGPEFDAQPPDGVYRLVALGDSCTAGHWQYVYPGILQRILNAPSAGPKFEVINAGIEGYNSEAALARLTEDVLQYNPRMVTIYIGWNDLMKIDPSSPLASGKPSWVATLLEKSYLVKAYRKLIFFYIRPILFQPTLSGGETDATSFDEFVPRVYRANLETMIRILRERRIEPILLTRPTVVTPHMTYEELQHYRVFFPYYADSYSVGKLLSLHRAYNRVVRAVGRDHDVPVVDLDEIFDRHDKRDLFWDTMHPSRKGQALIAESLAEQIRRTH